MTMIRRDAFARTELHRRTVKDDPPRCFWGCDWCGRRRRGDRLFVYRTETDGGRTFEHRGRFCCLDCHNAWHGVDA
jgi:hypothetical protein